MKQSLNSDSGDIIISPVTVETSRRSFIRKSSQLAIASATSLGVAGALFSPTKSYAVTNVGYTPPYQNGWTFCYSGVIDRGIGPTIGAYITWIEYWMKETKDASGDYCTAVNVYHRKTYGVNTEDWSLKHTVQEFKIPNRPTFIASTDLNNRTVFMEANFLAKAECHNRSLTTLGYKTILATLVPDNYLPGSVIYYHSSKFLGAIAQIIYVSYRVGTQTYYRFAYFHPNKAAEYVATVAINALQYQSKIDSILAKINAYNLSVNTAQVNLASSVISAAVGSAVGTMAGMTGIPAVGVATGFVVAASTGVISINNAFYEAPTKLVTARLAMQAFDMASWSYIIANNPGMNQCIANGELRI